MNAAVRPPVRGLSIVEIMVGLAVGLVLVAGMSNLVLGSRQTSRIERNLLEMQTIGRIGIDFVGREIRNAGFRANRERSLADSFPVAATPFLTAAAVVAGEAPAGGLTLRFQGVGDNWSSDCLGNLAARGDDVWESIWLQGAQIQCRVRNRTTNTDQTLALIPQIEALNVTYGIDDDGDGFADAYRAAAAVADWSRVASVNLALRVVSSEDGLAATPQPYLDFDGAAVTPNDRRLRRSYSTVIALRNLLP
jgi:type IV pilus assembly protein PilW